MAEANEGFASFQADKGAKRYAELKEAAASEQEEASQILLKSFRAREAGDFSTQCATLATAFIEELSTEVTGVLSGACATDLQKLAEPLPTTEEVRENTMKGRIDAMRLHGTRAYAFFHGRDGKDYVVPLEDEDGHWKVRAILATPLG